MSGMTLCWRRWGWKLAISSSFFVGGALALGGGLSPIASFGDCALAQSKIVPDDTLGTESSVVTPVASGLAVDLIDGGAIRGANLFHSFQEFNISEGRGAYFFSPSAGIQNILARVTGTNPSKILGTLGTFGNSNPNLFLINPNGIIFGPNASLDIGGSFVATTANAVRLGKTELFSASEPATSNLLTVNPSALFFNSLSSQAIVNRSTATTTVLGFPTIGLQVPDGQSLLLVGGDVRLDGGILLAPGGRVELGGLAASGTVELNAVGNNLSLSLPESVAPADVSLINGAKVIASGEGGGDIQVQGRRVTLTDGSQIRTITFGSKPGGTLAVTASEAVEVIGTSPDSFPSGLFAETDSSGSAGNLRIATRQLIVRDGAEVSVSTSGEGQGGNLVVNASESVELNGSADGRSGLFAETQGAKAAGDLTIATGRLIVRDGAEVSASTYGEGQGGNLVVNASESVELIGRTSLLSALTLGTGAAGDLRIATGKLIVQDGSQVSVSTYGEGQGGNLTVNASQAVELIGRRSRLSAQTLGAKPAGNLQIETGQLIVRDGAQISASTFGEGQGGTLNVNASESVKLIGVSPDPQQVPSGLFTQAQGNGAAGNLTIATGKLIVQDGAQVSATNYGDKQGGTLNVNASDSVELIGESPDGSAGGLSTQAQGNGAAGNLTIATGKLIVQDGAQVLATTYGKGSGGSLTVNASDSVELSGRTSGLFADTQGAGAAGDLTITTGKLIARDEAQVFAGTAGEGQGGNLTVNASDSVELIGLQDAQFVSGLFTTTQGSSAAGNLTIKTGQLVVRDGAEVAVNSQGTGDAGDLEVAARSIQLDNQGTLTAETDSGQGGNIKLHDLDLLLMRRGSQVSATAGTASAGGDGGNIDIKTKFIVAVPSENSDIAANAYTGKGGRVQINSQGIFGTQFREKPTPQSDITASSRFGVNGVVEINTPDIDPSRGLVNLPEAPISEGLITQGCPADKENTFTVTGRGGLPPQPGEALRTSAVVVNGGRLEPEVENRSTSVTTPVNSTPAPLVEAQGWVINAQGQVVLTSAPTTVTPDSSRSIPHTCYAP